MFDAGPLKGMSDETLKRDGTSSRSSVHGDDGGFARQGCERGEVGRGLVRRRCERREAEEGSRADVSSGVRRDEGTPADVASGASERSTKAGVTQW
jgi:hypothetical protein